MAIVFKYHAITEVGGRDTNEDYYENLRIDGYYCWVVADGLGGHSSGEIASKTVVKSIIEAFKSNRAIKPKTIAHYIDTADKAIAERIKNEPDKTGMMSTVAILLSNGKKAIWGHVGDTRLYMFRDGRVYHQTKDHSLVQKMVDRGEITHQEMRYHEDRNRLLSAIGGKGGVKKTVLDSPVELLKGDAFLICTDGLWEYISEIEMISDLVRSVTPQEWLTYLQLRIVSRAKTGNDNYTAIGIFID